MEEVEGIQFVYDEESGTWKRKEEPFAIVEFATEEDYERFLEMVEFWNENHKEEALKIPDSCEIGGECGKESEGE
jgi:hypothetical protein